MNQTKEKPHLVIVGAGISGLSAGIYALDNGFDVDIYEKHTIAGGLCTGWERQGLYIDGCAHWIVGTNPKSDLYPLWKHVGAFDERTTIYPNDYFCKFDLSDGRIFTFWSDPKKLKDEMMAIAPEDKWQILRFMTGIKTYRHVRIPVHKPIDKMNLWEMINFGIRFVPLGLHYLSYKFQSTERYARRFKSPALREVLNRIIDGRYCVHSLFYIMQALSHKDAGMPAGGSRQMAQRIANHFVERGGRLHLGQEVERVVVEDKTAKGIVLKRTGERIDADYVIASNDLYHTLHTLLEEKIKDASFNEKVENRKDNPLISCVMAAFRLSGANTEELPRMMSFRLKKPIQVGSLELKCITVRNHAFDTELYKDDVTLTVLIDVPEDLYFQYKSMERKEYLKYKKELGEKLRTEIVNYFKFQDEQVGLLDVSTPLTFRRYTNAWRGAYMSFLTTTKSKELMRKGIIKGLNNFYLAGQWLMSPGGLPIALFTGKHAIYRIMSSRGEKFKELDFKK